MTEFVAAFAPGMRHVQEQRDLEKIFVVDQKKGGSGPRPLDLDSGAVNVVLPKQASTRQEPMEDRDQIASAE